ncbi:MAG: lambda exonuclease family protein [Aquidulcibacter sp.]
MTVKIYDDLIQGSEEWLKARLGLLTASEIRNILTPTLKVADNDKTRAHVYELAAQRISQYVEPHYISDDMIRGHQDEALAVYLYSEKIAPVTQVGFITRQFGDFTIGYSPDGLVGDDGLLEVKSRRQKYQVQTIAELLPANQIAPEYVMQAQTGLLVTGRKWLDHISYCGGLPMAVVRVFPDPVIQDAILNAAIQFEAKVAAVISAFEANSRGLLPTERVIEQDIFV